MTTTDSLSWESAVLQLRAQPQHSELVRACFYDDPLLAAAQRYHTSSEWRAVQRLVGVSRGKALDVGAGRGIASYALATDGWTVTALEPDPSKIVGANAIRSLASEAGLRIDVVQQWGEQLPFDTGSFGLVHCRQVLHHARELKQFCREVARVLAPGGQLIATREHVISKPEDLDKFLQSHPLHRHYGGEHAYMLAEYVDGLIGAGLSVDRVFNPYESDINLYPESTGDLKRRWARKTGLPIERYFPDALLSWVGGRSEVPGRLYSFLAHKPG